MYVLIGGCSCGAVWSSVTRNRSTYVIDWEKNLTLSGWSWLGMWTKKKCSLQLLTKSWPYEHAAAKTVLWFPGLLIWVKRQLVYVGSPLSLHVFSKISVSSVAQSCPTLQPHGLQHARLSCPSNSRSLLKLKSFLSVMPFNHLIPCCPLLLLPSIFPNITVFFQWICSSHQVDKVL